MLLVYKSYIYILKTYCCLLSDFLRHSFQHSFYFTFYWISSSLFGEFIGSPSYILGNFCYAGFPYPHSVLPASSHIPFLNPMFNLRSLMAKDECVFSAFEFPRLRILFRSMLYFFLLNYLGFLKFFKNILDISPLRRGWLKNTNPIS